MTESSKHPNIELMTYSEIEGVEGFVGNFAVTIRKRARYVDMSKCTGCGECYQRCPTKVDSEFNGALSKRKAIYVPFLQAVPNVPVIDKENCLYFKKGKCRVCEKFCPTGAIDYEQKDEIIKRRFGAIIVATGFDMFDVSAYPELSPDDPDVITSLQFERMCDSAGPTGGHIVRPSTGEPAREVVFLQCVGSRDESKGVPYCSRICCMYTAKHALLLREHEPDAQAYVFYMDIRAGGKNYEEFTRRVQREYGAAFIRGRISKVAREGDKLVVWGVDSIANVQIKIRADLVVLAPAIVPRHDAKRLAQLLNVPTDQYGFFVESHPKLQPVQSVTSGVFLAGACQAPKDIPDVVAQSGAAAVAALSILTKDYLLTEAKVALVNEELCTGCFNCIEVCPYGAVEKVTVENRPVARVNKSLCRGCGNCASACRSKVISVLGFTDEQIFSQIEAILGE